MAKLKTLAAVCLLLFSLSLQSCVYANFTTTLDEDLNNTELGDKTGESSYQTVGWLVTWGDGGTKAAATDGGITTVLHADRRVLNVLWGLYSKVTTVVYGK